MLLTLRIAAWRARRLLLAGGLVVVACMVAKQAAPSGEPLRDVVVAAQDLAPGTRLTSGDLRVASVPARFVPDGTPGVDELPGRRVTASVPAGLPLVAGLVGAELVDGAWVDDARFGLAPPPGTVTVPVRLADPAVAAMLRPGDRVDLVAPDDGAATPSADAGAEPGSETGVLARAALVLEVVTGTPDGGDAGALSGWAGPSAADEPLVVVAVAPDEGHRLAAAGWGSLGAVVVQGS